MLILPDARQKRQKQLGPVAVDWKNPLTRGLKFAAIFNGGDLVGGTLGSKIGSSALNRKIGSYGPELGDMVNSGSANTRWEFDVDFTLSDGVTFAILAKGDHSGWASSTWGSGITLKEAGASYLFFYPHQTWQSPLVQVGTLSANRFSDALSWPNEGYHWVIYSDALESSTTVITLDGDDINTGAAVGHASSLKTFNARTVEIGGNSQYGGEGWEGSIAAAMVWNRRLNRSDHNALNDDGFQLFKSLRQRILFTPSGAPPVTGNIIKRVGNGGLVGDNFRGGRIG